MRKYILVLLCFCTLLISAKTRYVAFNDINMNIETYDSLGNVTHEYLNTQDEYLVKNINNFQITAYSIPVSEEESKAIKKAKAAQGWATAAMVASAVSSVAHATSSFSHHGHGYRHSWWYHHDMLMLSNMNFIFSAGLYNNAVKALNELKDFEGTAIIISNDAMEIKTVFVDGMQYFIAPKDTKAFNIGKNNTTIIIKEENTVTKLTVNATREVKKLYYDFADNDFYYRTTKGNNETVYQQLPKGNVQRPNYIDKVTYKQCKAYSKSFK